MTSILLTIINLYKDERGISSVEYVLLTALIAGGIVLAADALAGAVADRLADTASCFQDQQTANGGNGGGAGLGGGSGGSGGLGSQNGQGFAGC